MEKIYPLYTDLVSKYIFGTQENVKFLEDLLESVFDMKPGSLKGMQVLNSVNINKDYIQDKDMEMDIVAKTPTGEIINVEFYSNYTRSSEIKSLMYISKTFATQLKKGEEYLSLKKLRQINFIKGNYLHHNGSIINKYLIINEKDKKDQIMPDLFQIYIIDIDKNLKVDYNINERLRDWIKLIGAGDKKKMEEATKSSPIMKEALEKMKEFSSEEWFKGYFTKERLVKSQILEAKTEGISEGIEQGIEQGVKEQKIEIAKTMLQKNETVEYVSEITDLPIKEVEKLKETLENKN